MSSAQWSSSTSFSLYFSLSSSSTFPSSHRVITEWISLLAHCASTYSSVAVQCLSLILFGAILLLLLLPSRPCCLIVVIFLSFSVVALFVATNCCCCLINLLINQFCSVCAGCCWCHHDDMMVQTEMTKLLLLLLTTGHEKRNREEDTKDRIEIGEVYTIHGWPSTVCGSTFFVRCFLIIEFTSKWCDLCVIGGKVLVSTSFVLSFCLCLLCSKWQSQYFTL